MLLWLGILALILAVVLWLAKAVISFVFTLGTIGIVIVIIGLYMMMRRRNRTV